MRIRSFAIAASLLLLGAGVGYANTPEENDMMMRLAAQHDTARAGSYAAPAEYRIDRGDGYRGRYTGAAPAQPCHRVGRNFCT